MKNALILLCFTAAMFAADQPAAKEPVTQPGADTVKKLGSVTWDLDSHKLVWVVQTGTIVNGQFSPTSEQRYEISPEEATMAATGEKRGFDDDEAASLQQLLDVLSLYCAQSVVWWDSGLGTPVGPQTTPQSPDKKTPPPSGQKPVKVGEPKDQPAPKPLPNTIVAMVRL